MSEKCPQCWTGWTEHRGDDDHGQAPAEPEQFLPKGLPHPGREGTRNQPPGALLCRTPKLLPRGDGLPQWALRSDSENTGAANSHGCYLQPGQNAVPTERGLALLISQLTQFVVLARTALPHPLHTHGYGEQVPTAVTHELPSYPNVGL